MAEVTILLEKSSELAASVCEYLTIRESPGTCSNAFLLTSEDGHYGFLTEQV